ncbi:MAG: glycosyltransferase [Dehalococcoidales bacterium]
MKDKKFNVAMLSVHSCPLGQLGGRDTGGMNVYIRELACALGRQGHRVDVYTRAHDPRDAQVESLGPNVRLIHIRAGEVRDMGKLVQHGHLADFRANLEDFRRGYGLSYDLIYSHYWLSGEVGAWLAESWRVPNIIMFHTLGAVKNSLSVGQKETALRLDTEKKLMAGAQRIITATEMEKRDLVHHYGAVPQKIGVVPCGVNLELFKKVDRRDARDEIGLNGQKVALFVGRIDSLKGIDNLMMAMAILRRRQPRLLVIGGDEHSRREVARLNTLGRKLGISETVSFLGTVPQERLPLYYSAADVCVVPSYYETFGLVTLESLACGTPVVATDVGAAASIIRDGKTGYLVADNDPPKLADRIGRLLWPDEGADHDSGSIRDSVMAYGWPGIARRINRQFATAVDEYEQEQVHG